MNKKQAIDFVQHLIDSDLHDNYCQGIDNEGWCDCDKYNRKATMHHLLKYLKKSERVFDTVFDFAEYVESYTEEQ